MRDITRASFSYDVKYILPPFNPERPVHIELSPVREFYDLGHLSHSVASWSIDTWRDLSVSRAVVRGHKCSGLNNLRYLLTVGPEIMNRPSPR